MARGDYAIDSADGERKNPHTVANRRALLVRRSWNRARSSFTDQELGEILPVPFVEPYRSVDGAWAPCELGDATRILLRRIPRGVAAASMYVAEPLVDTIIQLRYGSGSSLPDVDVVVAAPPVDHDGDRGQRVQAGVVR